MENIRKRFYVFGAIDLVGDVPFKKEALPAGADGARQHRTLGHDRAGPSTSHWLDSASWTGSHDRPACARDTSTSSQIENSTVVSTQSPRKCRQRCDEYGGGDDAVRISRSRVAAELSR
jgi:hypothetical protein